MCCFHRENNKMDIKQIIREELKAVLSENTESPYYAEQARLGKIRQMGHDDAVAGKEPVSTMAIYRVGYQAGMKSKKEKPMSKYDFFSFGKSYFISGSHSCFH